MSTADTYVRARIDTATKERAADALEAMCLTISYAIRLLMLRIADERRLPFDVKCRTRLPARPLPNSNQARASVLTALMHRLLI